jgi:hypothetical protein
MENVGMGSDLFQAGDRTLAQKILSGDAIRTIEVELPTDDQGGVIAAKIDEVLTEDALRWAYHPFNTTVVEGKSSPIVLLTRNENESYEDLRERLRLQFYRKVEEYRLEHPVK